MILLINGVPVVQIELKTLAISPRRAMQQIVDYKHVPGNGYSKTLIIALMGQQGRYDLVPAGTVQDAIIALMGQQGRYDGIMGFVFRSRIIALMGQQGRYDCSVGTV